MDAYYVGTDVVTNARYLGEAQRGKYLVQICPGDTDRHVTLEWVPAKGGGIKLNGVYSLVRRLGHALATSPELQGLRA